MRIRVTFHDINTDRYLAGSQIINSADPLLVEAVIDGQHKHVARRKGIPVDLVRVGREPLEDKPVAEVEATAGIRRVPIKASESANLAYVIDDDFGGDGMTAGWICSDCAHSAKASRFNVEPSCDDWADFCAWCMRPLRPHDAA